MIEIGKKYNNLLVISLIGKDNQGAKLFLCLCDCGQNSKVRSYPLESGMIKSCGCLKKAGCTKRKLNDGIASYRRIIGRYKRNAEKYNRDCTLSEQEFINFFNSNCYYCNSEPILINPHTKNKHVIKDIIKFNGIDRVDTKMGYILENCVTCCIICNRAKSTLSQTDFINHCLKIIKHVKVNAIIASNK